MAFKQMTIEQLCATINLANRDFSLVLVRPKDNMLEWLTRFWQVKCLDMYRNYSPEENTVLVIPNTERFSKVGLFERFLEVLKPRLLFVELVRFHVTPEEFGRPLTKETFDEVFDLGVRDSASIRFISDFNNIMSDLKNL